MDRSEKLAVARRKVRAIYSCTRVPVTHFPAWPQLRKFQARGSAASPAGAGGAGTGDKWFSEGLPGSRWGTMMPATPPVTSVVSGRM